MSLALIFNPPVRVRIVTPTGNIGDALKPPPYITDSVAKGIITLDASMNEDEEYGADLPQFPIHDGSVITDHHVNLPDVLTLTGRITDTPVQYLSAVTAGGGFGNIFGIPTRSQKAYEALRQLKEGGELFTIVTKRRVWSNVQFLSLRFVNNAQVGKRIEFTATLRQIRVVDTNPAATAALDLAASKTAYGYVPGVTPDLVTIAGALVFLTLVVKGNIS